MVKVLYVITELDPGGAEGILFELARGLDRDEFEPTVAALSGRGIVGEWLDREGIKVHYLGESRPLAVLRLRRLIRRLRPEIVHSFLFHANVASRFAAVGLGVDVVIGSIRVTEANRPFRLWLDHVTQGLTTIETCVCEAVRKFTIERAGVPSNKLVTISNGIDASRYEGVEGTLRAELGLSEGDLVVTTVARLDEQKGVEHLVNVAIKLLPEFPRAHFAIVGDGPQADEMRRATASMDDRIHLLGQRYNVPSILASSDLFVLPSLWEGMPNVVLEAMAAGLPVVASSVGGCPELIEDGVTGLLVEPGDEASLKRAITTLLIDPVKRQSFGAAARDRVRREFTLGRMIEANEALYRRTLAKKKRGF